MGEAVKRLMALAWGDLQCESELWAVLMSFIF